MLSEVQIPFSGKEQSPDAVDIRVGVVSALKGTSCLG